MIIAIDDTQKQRCYSFKSDLFFDNTQHNDASSCIVSPVKLRRFMKMPTSSEDQLTRATLCGFDSYNQKYLFHLATHL